MKAFKRPMQPPSHALGRLGFLALFVSCAGPPDTFTVPLDGRTVAVGSTAPFIGLFGTVIGIITAFQGIAAAGGGGIGAVSAGIAEALIVTAVGLFVAITAVLFFNYLSGRFDQLDMSMQHSAGELVDFLEGRHGNGG